MLIKVTVLLEITPYTAWIRQRGKLPLCLVSENYLVDTFTLQHCPKVPCPPLESTFQPDPGEPAALATEQQEAVPPPSQAGEGDAQNRTDQAHQSSNSEAFWNSSADTQEESQLPWTQLEMTKKGRPVPRRQPHRTPVLQPYFRWCTRYCGSFRCTSTICADIFYRCEIVKPPRTQYVFGAVSQRT